jgi:putative ABC transport system permease protein
MIYGLKGNSLENPKVDGFGLIEGRRLTEDDIGKSKILIDHKFFNDKGMSIGEKIKIRLGTSIQEVEIIGTVVSPEWIYIIDPETTSFNIGGDFIIGYTNIETLQNWVMLPNRVNELMFIAQDNIDIKELGANLKTYFTELGFYVEFKARTEMASYDVIEDDFVNDTQMFQILAIFIFVVALFGLWISINRLVTFQKREIGIELSLGNTSGKIMAHYLAYGLLIGVLGMGATFFTGWVFAIQLDKLNQSFYPLPNWQNPMVWEGYGQACGLVLLFSFLASWWPARQASRLLPIKAMRTDPAVSAGQSISHSSMLLCFFERIFRFSLASKMAVRNLFRSKKRTLATILGFGLSVGLIIGTIGVFSSMDNVVQSQSKEMGDWTLKATLYAPMPVSTLSSLMDQEEIDTYCLSLAYFAHIEINGGEEVIQLTSFYGCDLIPKKISEGSISNESMNIALSGVKAKTLGIALNDEIKVEHAILNLPTGYILGNSSVKVSAFHEKTNMIEVFMEWQTIQALLNASNSANQIYIKSFNENIQELKDYLYTLPFVRIVEERDEMIKSFDAAFDDFEQIMYLIEAMCLLLAFGVVLLTSMITRSERQREIGTMATLGAPDTSILGVSLWESLFLAVLGIAFGYVFGLLVLDFVIIPTLAEVMEGFILEIYIPENMYYLVGGVTVGLALLSQLPVLDTLSKMDLAQATKVRDF